MFGLSSGSAYLSSGVMTLSPGVKTQWSRFESRDGARISHPASKSLDRLSLVIGHSVGVEVLQPHIGLAHPSAFTKRSKRGSEWGQQLYLPALVERRVKSTSRRE